jgi:DNA segregation ATPase FtsK/SpoIIIE-like protein
MKYEHKAIISKAQANGCSPMEYAPELLAHDLVDCMKKIVSGHAVAFRNMSEQQQDACLAQMQVDVKDAVDIAIGVIHAAGSKTVRMTLTKAVIGTKWQFTGAVSSTEEFLHELGNKAQDKSDVLVLIAERDYFQGLDAIQGEKDQKSLPLETEGKPEKKPRGQVKKAADIAKAIELPPALIEQARDFVTKQQNGSVSGLQNHLKCNIDKAKALHDVLVDEGLLGEAMNDRGDRDLVRAKSEAVTDAILAVQVAAAEEENLVAPEQSPPNDDSDVVDATLTILTEELYIKAKTAVILDRRVSVSFLKGELTVDDDTAAALLDRLEDDGVVSEEDEIGCRSILIDA